DAPVLAQDHAAFDPAGWLGYVEAAGDRGDDVATEEPSMNFGGTATAGREIAPPFPIDECCFSTCRTRPGHSATDARTGRVRWSEPLRPGQSPRSRSDRRSHRIMPFAARRLAGRGRYRYGC